VVKGTRIELAVMLAAFYGLRRSEAIGGLLKKSKKEQKNLYNGANIKEQGKIGEECSDLSP
jgi:hypothetical protein